jgi:hypothetical protein
VVRRPFHLRRFFLVVVGTGSRDASRGAPVKTLGPVCLCTQSPFHTMPPRITRNGDRPRASNKTMVDTQLPDSRPSFKTRLAWSPPEDETCGTGKQTRAKPLDRKREDLSDSGLDLETKIFRPPVEGEVFSWQSLFIERLDPETVRGWTSIPRGRSKVDLSL